MDAPCSVPSSPLKPLDVHAAGGKERPSTHSHVSHPTPQLNHQPVPTNAPPKGLSSPHISSLLSATLKARPSVTSCQDGGHPPHQPPGSLCCSSFSPTQRQVTTSHSQIHCRLPPPPILSPDASSFQPLPLRPPCIHWLGSAFRTQLRGSFLKNLLPVPSPTRTPMATPGSRDRHTGDSLACWAINRFPMATCHLKTTPRKKTRCLVTPTMVIIYGPILNPLGST